MNGIAETLFFLILVGGSTAKKNGIYKDRYVKYRSLLTGEDVLLKAPQTRQAADTSCLVDDIHCVLENGNIIDAFFSVNSAVDCQYTCSKTVKNCRAFTWFGNKHPIFPNSCFLFSGCKRARSSGGTVSGPVSCSCGSHSACQGVRGNFVKFQENVGAEDTCQGSCKDNDRCKFYTWFGPKNKIFSGYCFLFSSCEKSSCNCKDCYSGPPSCFEYELVQDPEILDDDIDDGDLPEAGVDPLFPDLTPGAGIKPVLIGGGAGAGAGALGGSGHLPGSTGATSGAHNPGDPMQGVSGGSGGVSGGSGGLVSGGLPSGSSGGSLLGGQGGLASGGQGGLATGGLGGLSTGGQGGLMPGGTHGEAGGLSEGGFGMIPGDHILGNGGILQLKPGLDSLGKYESAVVNYMPALKWLLVVMDHQRRLEDHQRRLEESQ